jgi:hypothetical protein
MLVELSDYDEEDRPWGTGCLVGLLIIFIPWAIAAAGLYWFLLR